MTIKEFHDSIRELANIGQGQYYAPETIDLFINNSIKDLFRQEYKHFESTQEISDTLGYYKKVTSPIGLDVTSIGDLPADLYHVTNIEAILSDQSRVPCEQLTDSEFLSRKHSKGFAPSLKFPIARLIGTKKIEALPIQVIDTNPNPDELVTAGVDKIVLYYLSQPATVKFAYTINGEGTGWVYDESGSVQVDWPEIGHNLIRDKALGLIGISLRDTTLISSETVRKTQNEEK